MYNIFKLLGRPPFKPLQEHMNHVSQCVELLPDLIDTLLNGNYDKATQISKSISRLEHDADAAKQQIRKNLPRSMFLPISRVSFLDILDLQDSIADRAEDTAIIMTLCPFKLPLGAQKDFPLFLKKNLQAFKLVVGIIDELQDLVEASFGGVEAERVLNVIEQVAFFEHEADKIQRSILASVLTDNALTAADLFQFTKSMEALSGVSNQSEKLANRIRSTLEI